MANAPHRHSLKTLMSLLLYSHINQKPPKITAPVSPNEFINQLIFLGSQVFRASERLRSTEIPSIQPKLNHSSHPSAQARKLIKYILGTHEGKFDLFLI